MNMTIALGLGLALQAVSGLPEREVGTAEIPLVRVQTGMDFVQEALNTCMANCSGTRPGDPSAPMEAPDHYSDWDPQRYDLCIQNCYAIHNAQRDFMRCIEMAERAHPHSPHWQPEDRQAAQERLEAALERCRQQYQHARP